MMRAFRSRHAAPLFLAAALACSSGGGAKAPEAAPVPAAMPSDIPPVRVVLGTAPSFEGVATGNGWTDGSASAEAGHGTSGSLRLAWAGVRAAGRRHRRREGQGVRHRLARLGRTLAGCRDPEAGRGTVGFAVNATATARRGSWRTKATLSCTTINYTEAQAATMARGQA